MNTAIRDRRQELLALGPNLLGRATELTRGPAEARALVNQTLELAGDPGQAPSGDVSTRTWAHRLLRRCFYSVERDRSYRRSTSAAVTELGSARKRELQAQAEAEEEARPPAQAAG
jgi:DNA-directed RNA polymerase specialized sigma24 family protein